jgi:hypothetical protein
MAAPKILTREEWAAHALQLAEARHLTGTARWQHADQLAEVFAVPSGDRRVLHTVRLVHASGELIRCDCTASSYGRPCGHAGAVVHALWQREQATGTAGADEALRWWLNGGEW